jgi:acyl-coenzyme A thioesterase PaaI-like protein
MTYDPAAHGWRELTGAGLPGGLGNPWSRKTDAGWDYGFLTRNDHANPNGVVHGGIMMTFADHGLSFMAWEAAERVPCATIQLNTHFLDGIKPGAFIVLRGQVTRRTRGLVFLRGDVLAYGTDGERPVGAVDGIWRVLRAAS